MKKTHNVLTPPQAAGLYALLQAKEWGRPVPAGRETRDEHEWAVRINSRVAAALVSLGLARSRNLMPDGTEVSGAKLVHLLGYWKPMYEITKLGERAWALMTVEGRCGLPDRASRKAGER